MPQGKLHFYVDAGLPGLLMQATIVSRKSQTTES